MTTTSSASPVRLEMSESVARLTFNRPDALNAINPALANAFLSAIQTVASSPRIRVLLLRGDGRAFMAGGDLTGFRDGDPVGMADSLIKPIHAGIALLAQLPMPVVASVHGAVAGAGLSITLAADLAIAADDTTFSTAYIKIGASPDASSSWHLPRIVGLRKAMEICLLGERIDAHEALRLSLVNRVVPTADLVAQTEALVQRLAAGPTVALARTKQLLRAAQTSDLASQLSAEHEAFRSCAALEDFREGVNAFFDRRKPQYRGY